MSLRPVAGIIAAVAVAAATFGGAGCDQASQRGGDPAPATATPSAAVTRSGQQVPVGVVGSPSASASPQVRPLAGKIIGIDPGHNGGNFADPDFINKLVWNGREEETCDTTGTQTAGGYTEAQFNFNVAMDLRADLVAAGARVVLTRHSNDGVGPCVTTRTQIINAAHASVAIDIHADGGPVTGRGFTVLEPEADGPNDKVITPSLRFGADVRAAMLRLTRMPVSDYYGHDGLIRRDDLAGLNLTTVPKVLIECGNMPNATDARMLVSATFQQAVARALTAAIVAFLSGATIPS
ncbi:MAG TPA: N-acetylmuramoyl-L-alanine amidase [Streptosporangiaceae bacterium]